MTGAAVEIHTDGSCLRNPGPGGYAAVLRYREHEKAIQGGTDQTTNNQMELMACIAGLEQLKKPCEVNVYTDSQYVYKGITVWINGWLATNWKNGTVKNIQLWKRLKKAVDRHKVKWHWIKGHNGDQLNEKADKLARLAAEAVQNGQMESIDIETE